MAAVAAAKARGNRVWAVGTTALRALESAARSGSLQAGQGDTDIFITPGYEFKVVDRLITNFHLPKSTLLMLVSALAGYDEIRTVYQHAIAEQYRFFSYGDAMILGNKAQSDYRRVVLFNALGCLKILSECFINLEAFYKYLRLPESQSTGHKKTRHWAGFFVLLH